MAYSQLAATFALIVPFVFTMSEIVMPSGTVMAVTVRLPGLVSASLTVATVELKAAVPWLRAIPTGAMLGVVFGVGVGVAVGTGVGVGVGVGVAQLVLQTAIAVSIEPLVVRLRVQPPAIVPELPVCASCTYKLQTLPGSVPLKADNV